MGEMSVEEAVRQAIAREEESYELYSRAREMVTDTVAQAMLEELATQELGHKAKLEVLLKGDASRIAARAGRREIIDLKIADYLAPAQLDEEADLQQVLIVAMQKEKDSNQLYEAMTQITEGSTQELFRFLAGEELAHKNRVQELYDEIIYRDN